MSNVRTQIGKVIGKSLNGYHSRVKPKIDELRFKEQYQGRIIDCMVGEVDDNYIETPLTDENVVKLEHSKEGVIKIPQIKGKTILIDADRNETDTPGEGCRLVSVGEEEDNKLIILSNNKNLVHKNNIIKGRLFWGEDINIFKDAIGSTEQNNIMLEHCIKVEPNTEYYIQYETDKAFHIMKYDKQGNHIIGDYVSVKNGILRTNANTHYINIFLVGGNRPDSVDLTQDIKTLKETFMIEKADVKNSFVEGKCHKTEILLNEPLRSLPNGVKDEIVGNQLIRRVGKMNFSDLSKIGIIGSVAWGSGNSHGAYQWTNVSNGENKLNYKHSSNKNTPNVVTDLYPYDNAWHGGNANGNPEGLPEVFFGISNDGHARLMVAKKIINPENPSSVIDKEIKTWVEENLNLDVEFVYELAEPIIEELPNGITLQGFDDTTMYIENSITPTVSYGYNALIPYKEELLNQKEEVETNTLDIEQNIIPYLMDMEFNLMLMEDN